MDKNKAKPDHLLVRNPLTGTFLNILPLLEFMYEDQLDQKGPPAVVGTLQDVHDVISVTMNEENDWAVGELAGSLHRLIRLRKSFERMTEIVG